MFINAAMFNVIHPGVLLPSNPHVYLLANGMEAEDDSPEGTLEDTRPLKMKILDPLDIKGLFRKKQQLKPYQQRPLGGDDETMSESMIMLENRQHGEFRQ